MPVDYQSAAKALAIPTTPSPVNGGPGAKPSLTTSTTSTSSPSAMANPLASPRSGTPTSATLVPPWARPSSAASRRLSTRRPYSRTSFTRASSQQPFTTRLLATAHSIGMQSWKLFVSLSTWQQALVVAVLLLGAAVAVLALVFSHAIFAWLGPAAASWSALPGGWVLAWLLTFVCAFPPMIGYSTTLTLAGFVYRFPMGWPIVASASVAGSLAAFLASRTVLAGYVHRLVGGDKRFVALGQVLRRDGLGVLTMIRLCPLPFSLSNGFLATIPSIRPWAFAASTAFASPKLLVHVYIGSNLRELADNGDKMSAGAKALNLVSIVGGGLLGVGVGLWIYKRTMARAAELAREEAEEIGAATGEGGLEGGDGEHDENDLDLEAGYLDEASESSGLLHQRLRDPDEFDADAAALVADDDDISLWETEVAASAGVDDEHGDEGGTGAGGYRDSVPERDGDVEAGGKKASGGL